MLTEENCGITAEHVQIIATVAKTRSTFIFVRPVNRDATSLIASGLGTKRLDMHAKSSDWGPMAGFICVDSMLSKVVDDGEDAIKRNDRAVAEALRNGGVGQVQLVLSEKRISELVAKALFFQPGPGQIFGAHSAKCRSSGRFQFERNATDAQLSVYYFPVGAAQRRPLMVLGYRKGSKVVPVTADYDLFAICPHFSAPGFHPGSVARVQEQGIQGTLSSFQQSLIRDINRLCGKLPVVNHGTELNNPFPEADPELAMFVPGARSRMVLRRDLPAIFGDLAMSGFHVYYNTRWAAAATARYGTAISQLRNPARRGAYSLQRLTTEDLNGLSIAGYGGQTRTALAQEQFGTEVNNGAAAVARRRWTT